MSNITKFCLFAFVLFIFWSCNQDDEINDLPSFEVLVSIDSLGYDSVDDLKQRFGNNPTLNQVLSRGVSVFKIIYKTANTDGEEIEASGLIVWPDISGSFSVLSYQHGTLRTKAEAPSNYYTTAGSEATFVAPLFASSRFYLTVLPDYIGYGSSADYPHPYEHAQSTATSSFDFLLAVKEFMEYKEIAHNGKLFLAGYSQGGFSTMALTKYIEEQTDWDITVSAPAAGAYNKVGFAQNILTIDDNIPYMDVYLWVLHTYNRLYDNLNRPWSYYLNEPYATTAAGISEGPFTALNNTNPQELFTEAFKAELTEDNSPFMQALIANNNYDWRPTIPMRLYHGDIDDFVPPFNSSDAYEAMQNRGASQVELRLMEGKDHFTGPEEYFFDLLLNYFSTF